MDGTCKGAVHFFATVSQCLLAGMLSRPLLFLCLFGTRNPASNSSHESMKPRCVLLSMRIISVPADCTRSRFGAGRNRYVSAAPAWNRTPGLAVQNNKSRLSVAANKSCLQGRTSKIWSCAPAPYGKGTHVCAAFTGRVLQPVPGAVSALNSSLSEVASLVRSEPPLFSNRCSGRKTARALMNNAKIPR